MFKQFFTSRNLYIGIVIGGLLGLPIGFGLGVYYLPIIVAEAGADTATVERAKIMVRRTGEFVRDLKGSDGAHWGEGRLIESFEDGQYYYTLDGRVSPGPDYKLYLAPRFVDDEASFFRVKGQSVRVASINGFENFRVAVPMAIDPKQYAAVVIWCERFREFITAARLD